MHEIAFHVVECDELLLRLGPADDQLISADPIGVEGVERMTHLQHDVVGDVDGVGDRPHARVAETLSHPKR